MFFVVEKLRAKLDSLRSERQECEVQKEEMVKHVRGLHAKLIQEKDAGKMYIYNDQERRMRPIGCFLQCSAFRFASITHGVIGSRGGATSRLAINWPSNQDVSRLRGVRRFLELIESRPCGRKFPISGLRRWHKLRKQ